MDWMEIGRIAMLVAMFFFILPAAKWWLKHGPRGSSKQWLNASVLLAGVVLFVVFLMYSV
ncbi:MAG: hypothetical protein V3U76_13815 [Granulosicoccus sp.]